MDTQPDSAHISYTQAVAPHVDLRDYRPLYRAAVSCPHHEISILTHERPHTGPLRDRLYAFWAHYSVTPDACSCPLPSWRGIPWEEILANAVATHQALSH